MTKLQGPSGEESMEVGPDVRRRMRGRTRSVSTDQPTAPPSIATTDTVQQETAGDHDDERRRVDEPETPLSPVGQNEALVLNPVSFDWEREMMRSLQVFRCLRSQQKWAVISLKNGSRKRHFYSLTWCR